MEFVKVDIKIPQWVEEIFVEIQKIQPNSCIAGGFLCDLYLGKPYKDIDIFIKNDKDKKNLIKKLFEKKEMDFENVTDSPYINSNIFEVDKVEGYEKEIQLIYTDLGVKIVKYFDVHFREFFYFKGHCYASKEALKSIEEKKLKYGITMNPIRTLRRMFEFQEKYQFEIDRKELERLQYLINYSIFSEGEIEKFIENIENLKIKLKMKQFLREKTINKKIKNIKLNKEKLRRGSKKDIQNLTAFLKYNNTSREIAQKVYEKTDLFNEKIEVTFEENFYEKKLKERKEQLTNLFGKQKLRMVCKLGEKALGYEEKIKQMDDKIAEDFYWEIRNLAIANGWKIYRILDVLRIIVTLEKEKHRFSYNTEFVITNEFELSRGVTLKKYLDNDILYIKNQQLGVVVYDNKLKKVLTYTMLKEIADEIVDKTINKMNIKIS